MRGSRLATPVIAWDMVRAFLKTRRYTGKVVIDCAEGEPKMLEIPADPVPGQRFAIDTRNEIGAK